MTAVNRCRNSHHNLCVEYRRLNNGSMCIIAQGNAGGKADHDTENPVSIAAGNYRLISRSISISDNFYMIALIIGCIKRGLKEWAPQLAVEVFLNAGL